MPLTSVAPDTSMCSPAECRSSGANHGPFDHVAQLTNVSRPWISQQFFDRSLGERVDSLAALLGELVDELPREDGDVFNPLSKRRQDDGEDVEPIEEVFAERARANG